MKRFSAVKLFLVVSAAVVINATVLERSYDPDYKGVGHGGGDYDYGDHSHGRRMYGGGSGGDDYDDY
ncbi:hypothetical protein K493DRAFT_346674 [Basidiobolus meristosporus CBS 931.73]|uniref:Glycine-rich protein n=1 Tax=Basidiobolus meristosporus CBS 931.73 TaxID=1314790 RepID=A0A1Y1YWY2_9FUNG|nr:hypothetical protein K493DRAFT_346674 [Basidiobolus meristosporus CBS 931.73]|eukprot:ORY02530.1 hypothetical protein K493DRAFT_346674 [Basidiobolus meristosporus CBS 931.73]